MVDDGRGAAAIGAQRRTVLGARHRALVSVIVTALRAGRDVLVVGGRASGRTTHLHAAAHRLPGPVWWADAAATNRAQRPSAIIVDDLDRRSADRIPQHDGVPVLASALARPSAVAHCRRMLVALGRGEPQIVGLPDLDRTEVAALARRILHRELSSSTIDALVRIVGGRRGDIAAVLAASHASGVLIPRGEHVQATGALVLGEVDSDAVQRLEQLDRRARAAVETVALARTINLDSLERLTDAACVQRLVADGTLTTVRMADENTTVSFERPVDAELVARSLDPPARRQRLETLVDEFRPVDAATRERYATLAIEIGRGDVRTLVAAAWDAYRRGDLEFAETCATVAIDGGDVLRGRIARGAVRARRGAIGRALQDLAYALDVAPSAHARRRTAEFAAGLGLLGDVHANVDGRRDNDLLTDRLRDYAEPDTVRAYGAVRAAIAGDVPSATQALAAADVSHPSAGRELAAIANAVLAVVELDASRIGRARQLWASDPQWARPLPVGAAAIDAHEVELAVLSGQSVESLQIRATEGVRRATADDDGFAQVTWSVARGTADIAAGSIADAIAGCTTAAAVARSTGQQPALPFILARQTWAQLHAGAFESAVDALAELEVIAPGDRRGTLCRALLAALSFPQAGTGLVQDGARDALDAGHLAAAVEFLGIALRVGVVDSTTCSLLDRVATRRRTPRLDVMRAHATALSAGDADALDVASRRYARIGWRLVAVDATLQAVESGLDRDLGSRRAAALLDTCTSAWSPFVTDASAPQPTARERDVGSMAVSGSSNAEIARALSLSVRSVETYLTRLYRKFGVRGRRELKAFHAPWFATASPRRQRG